jgi:hypothetical protein
MFEKPGEEANMGRQVPRWVKMAWWVSGNESVDKLFGDNDMLSAHVSLLCGADKLILLSDVDGLYEQDPKKPWGEVDRASVSNRQAYKRIGGRKRNRKGHRWDDYQNSRRRNRNFASLRNVHCQRRQSQLYLFYIGGDSRRNPF